MQVATQNITVPKLRFKEFSHDWENKKLGELYPKLSTGMTPSRRVPSYFKGNIPWITSGELNYNVIDDTIEKITDLAVSETNLKLYPPFTFFIAITGLEAPGTRGKCAINGVPATTNQSCLAFTKNKNVNTNFLFYWYNKYGISLYFKYAQGTKQQSFNNKIVSKFEIALPTLPEQEKIASFLSAVDERIQKLERKKSLLAAYKKGVMRQLFSQEIRFKDENGNNYPDWEEKKLGDVGETFNGLSGKTKEDFGNGKPFIEYMQIFGSAKIDTSKFGLVNINEGEKQKRVLKGDILFTTSSETPNEIGFSSVLTEDVGELYLNSFCFGYRPFSLNDLYPEFASYLFRSESVRRDVIVLAQGSTRYNMSKVQLMKVSISIPSLIEQKKIASFLSSIDKKIELVETQIQQSKTFKKGLLQQMFV